MQPTSLAALSADTAPTLQAASIRLSTEPVWFHLSGGGGRELSVSGVAKGAPAERGGTALVALQFDRPVSAAELAGTGLALSAAMGPYAYIEPAPDGRPFSLSLRLPANARLVRLGLTLWNSREPVEIRDLRVLLAPPTRPKKLLVNLSVDVEALPGRAPSDHLDRLVYGRFGKDEFGLPLHMRLYRALGIPATFYLEYAACVLYGDAPVIEVGKRIVDEGFDLQLHFHPEVLVRHRKHAWPHPKMPSFARLDQALTREALEFGVEKFHASAGRLPDCFRSGSFHFNVHAIEAIGRLGVPAVSNYRLDRRGKNTFDFQKDCPTEPFQWSNGVLEVPITITPEPLDAYAPAEVWRRVRERAADGTWLLNVVVHSWSFTHRNAAGHHEFRDMRLLKSLQAFIESAPADVEFVSIGEVIRAVQAGELGVPLVKSTADLVAVD